MDVLSAINAHLITYSSTCQANVAYLFYMFIIWWVWIKDVILSNRNDSFPRENKLHFTISNTQHLCPGPLFNFILLFSQTLASFTLKWFARKRLTILGPTRSKWSVHNLNSILLGTEYNCIQPKLERKSIWMKIKVVYMWGHFCWLCRKSIE